VDAVPASEGQPAVPPPFTMPGSGASTSSSGVSADSHAPAAPPTLVRVGAVIDGHRLLVQAHWDGACRPLLLCTHRDRRCMTTV
jgi:hypothetical protein